MAVSCRLNLVIAIHVALNHGREVHDGTGGGGGGGGGRCHPMDHPLSIQTICGIVDTGVRDSAYRRIFV